MSSSSSSKDPANEPTLLGAVETIARALADISWSLQTLAKRHGDATMCDDRWKPYRPPTPAELEEAVRRMRNGA